MFRHLIPSDNDLTRPPDVPGPWLSRVIARLAEFTGIHEQASWRRRYGVAAVAVLIALVLRIWFDPAMGNRAAYGFFMVATAFVAWRYGLGPAIATLFTGVFLGWFFFERIWHAEKAEADLVPIIMSVTIGLVTVLVCESKK